MRTPLRAVVLACLAVGSVAGPAVAALTPTATLSTEHVEAGDVELAVLPGGGAVAIWREQRAGHAVAVASYRGPRAAGWGRRLVLGDPTDETLAVDVAALPDGRAVAAWQGSDGLRARVRSARGRWGPDEIIDARPLQLAGLRLVVGGDGGISVLWTTLEANARTVMVAARVGPGAWASRSLDADAPAGDAPAGWRDTGGRTWVVWADGSVIRAARYDPADPVVFPMTVANVQPAVPRGAGIHVDGGQRAVVVARVGAAVHAWTRTGPGLLWDAGGPLSTPFAVVAGLPAIGGTDGNATVVAWAEEAPGGLFTPVTTQRIGLQPFAPPSGHGSAFLGLVRLHVDRTTALAALAVGGVVGDARRVALLEQAPDGSWPAPRALSPPADELDLHPFVADVALARNAAGDLAVAWTTVDDRVRARTDPDRVDAEGPALRVAAPSPQRGVVGRGVLVRVRCPAEACGVRAHGRLLVAGVAVPLASTRRALHAGQQVALRVLIPRGRRAGVRAALARGRAVRAELVVDAFDATGNRTRRGAAVRVVRSA